MTFLENKDLVHRFYDEVYNAGDLAALDGLFAPSFRDHNPFGGESPDLTGLRHTVLAMRTAMPDVYVSIEDLIAEGDRVAARVTLRGTQRGEIMGIPPTGKQITLTAIDIFRIEDGKIVEHWGNRDDLGFFEQIGVLRLPVGAG